MRILLLLAFISISVISKSQRIFGTSVAVSHFTKDGRIYISYDSKSAQVQVFYPLDSIYKCKGNTFEPITDTAFSKGIWTIKLGSRTVNVLERQERLLRGHLMFSVMYACIDDKHIYCPCGAIFDIKK